MDDDKLIKTIHYMGIDRDNYSIVALLPLIQVAWADGAVQQEEREFILKIARQQVPLNQTGEVLLQNWLSFRPTDAYLQAGREVLLALAQRTEWEQVSINTINDVVGLSWDVAKAAGGLFGLGSVEAREKSALHAIAEQLQINRQDQIDAILMTLMPDMDDDDDTDTINRSDLLDYTDSSTASHISFHLNCPAREKSEALLVFENRGSPLVFPVSETKITIGRSRENEVQLRHDPFVSKHHCQISKTADGWRAKDLESANGTTVNGQQILARHLLGGERLKVGETYFDFVIR